MSAWKNEINKVLKQLKTAQTQFQTVLKDRHWVEEAKKYAESQGREMKKLINSDLTKVKAFLDREKKELNRFQKNIPGEIEKWKKYVDQQKKEAEKLVKKIRRLAKTKGASATTTIRKRKKTTASASKSSAAAQPEVKQETTTDSSSTSA